MTEEQIFDFAKHITDLYIAKEQDKVRDLSDVELAKFYANSYVNVLPVVKELGDYIKKQQRNEDEVNNLNTQKFV